MCWKPLQNYSGLRNWVRIAAVAEFGTTAAKYQRKRTGDSEVSC